jgi:hypothetical protein
MRRRPSAQIPQALHLARREIERWRHRQTGRKRLHREFWAKAVALAQEHGVHRNGGNLAKQIGQAAGLRAVHVLDEDERQPTGLRDVAQEAAEGLQPAGRCTHRNDAARLFPTGSGICSVRLSSLTRSWATTSLKKRAASTAWLTCSSNRSKRLNRLVKNLRIMGISFIPGLEGRPRRRTCL